MSLRNFQDPVYKQARLACLKRDKRKCQMPGCKARKKLQSHHIRKWSTSSSLRFEVSNLITLCKDHHSSIRGQEDHYIPLFEDIVRGK